MDFEIGYLPITVVCAVIASSISLAEVGVAIINARRGFRASLSVPTVTLAALVVVSCIFTLTQA